MNITEFKEIFKQHKSEMYRFDRVQAKLSRRPDLHAMILLDNIFPQDDCILADVSRDECVELAINCVALASVVTEEQIIDLIRCGVQYDGYVLTIDV